MVTGQPLDVLLEQDWSVIETYRRVVADMRREEQERQ